MPAGDSAAQQFIFMVGKQTKRRAPDQRRCKNYESTPSMGSPNLCGAHPIFHWVYLFARVGLKSVILVIFLQYLN